MKWSITFMLAGVLVIAFGLIPPYFGGVTINTLEVTASFVAVGVLIFLLGLLIRRARKVFTSSFANTTS